MNETKFWGPHPLENIYAVEWCEKNILNDALVNIAETLKSKDEKKFAEIRAAAFMLLKFSSWFKDISDFKPLFKLAIKKLKTFSENEDILKKYEFTVALKDQIKDLERIEKEL